MGGEVKAGLKKPGKIRYGQFYLEEVTTAVQSNHTQGSPASKDLVALLDHINRSIY